MHRSDTNPEPGARLPAPGPWQQIAENCRLGVAVLDTDARIVFVNRAGAELTGRTAQDVLGLSAESLLESVTEPDPAASPAATSEIVLRHVNGERVWLRTFQSDITGPDGEVAGHAVVLVDITREQRLKASMAEKDAMLTRLFDNLPDVCIEVGGERVIRFVSPACMRILGYTPDELVGQNVEMLFIDPAEVDEFKARMLTGERIHEWRVQGRHRDGHAIDVLVSASLTIDTATGRPTGYQGLIRDISEDRQARYDRDRIFELSADMLAIARHALFTRVNPAWTKVTGWSVDELLGHSPFEFSHPDDLAGVEHVANRLRAGQEIEEFRARFRCADGRYLWLSWHVAPPDQIGNSYCVVRDVTEAVAQEEWMNEMVMTLQAQAVRLEAQTVELERLRRLAEEAANSDALTGTRNRRAFFGCATQLRPTAMALLDIDRFKAVNDTYGHAVGDEVLKEVVKRAEEALGPAGLLGRIGGEEFGILFEEPIDEAIAACQAVVDRIGTVPFAIEGAGRLNIKVSAGLATWVRGGDVREQGVAKTYEAADRALYAAKHRGGNTTVVAPLSGVASAA